MQSFVLQQALHLVNLAVCACVMCPIAMAGNADPGVNHREHHQERRIESGARTGQLTPHERQQLEREQGALRREERAYRADGNLTPSERADLHHDLNATSRDIYREKHDQQSRFPAAAGAANRDPGVNQRQTWQRERVRQGVRSGELTHDEAKGLREERRGIRATEHEYKSDGSLSKDERSALHQDLNQSSKDIYSQKHDTEKRSTP
jgi:hypothetical protein